MNIGIFTDSFVQPNGVSTHVKKISKEMAERGHEVYVYTGEGETEEDYKIVNLPHMNFPPFPDYDMILPKSINENLDIVHSHTPYPAGWFGLIYGKSRGIPRVTTTHTLPEHMLSPYGMDFLSKVAWKYLVKWHNKSDFVIANTKYTGDVLASLGMDRPFTVASSGIDYDEYREVDGERAREEFDLPERFVLSTVRLGPEKKPELTLKACEELDIPVVLTSTGPKRAKLMKKYSDAKFLGYVEDEFIPSLYKAAEVTVYPTKKETEGLGPFESMASGTPVISSNYPTIMEYLEDGVNGYKFRTYGELVKRLKLLWNNEDKRQEFREEGLETAKKKDISTTADKLEEIYSILLGSR